MLPPIAFGIDKGKDLLEGATKQMQDAIAGVGSRVNDVVGSKIDEAKNSVAEGVQGVIDKLTEKLGPVLARVAFVLVALVLIAAAFMLLANSKKA